MSKNKIGADDILYHMLVTKTICFFSKKQLTNQLMLWSFILVLSFLKSEISFPPISWKHAIAIRTSPLLSQHLAFPVCQLWIKPDPYFWSEKMTED